MWKALPCEHTFHEEKKRFGLVCCLFGWLFWFCLVGFCLVLVLFSRVLFGYGFLFFLVSGLVDWLRFLGPCLVLFFGSLDVIQVHIRYCCRLESV